MKKFVIIVLAAILICGGVIGYLDYREYTPEEYYMDVVNLEDLHRQVYYHLDDAEHRMFSVESIAKELRETRLADADLKLINFETEPLTARKIMKRAIKANTKTVNKLKDFIVLTYVTEEWGFSWDK
ncbi:MAG: hypothetical protein LBC07_01035 [Elusimicrobiota bacterium]|jgi:hypothetical protein|nr:hypothetical protein [Elusimicrobiota bacterium]